MKYIFALFFILVGRFSMASEEHPFYVSVVEIHVNEDEKLLECAVKIFTDDLERALREYYQVGVLNIGAEKEADTATVLMDTYLKDKVEIEINGNQAVFQWVGKEGNFDHQWMYFEIPFHTLESLSMSSHQLMEVFSDQRNLVHFHFNNQQKTLIFKNNQTQSLIP